LLPLVPERLRPRLKAGGRTFIETAGMENVRRVIADVLLGVNVRNATETLTRRRLIAVRTALRVVFQQLLKAGYEPRQIPTLAVANLKTGRISREERWLNLWLLGLTQKSNTNVLRDDSTVLDEYAAKYVESHRADGEDDFDPFPNGGFHYEGEEGILLENLFGSSVSAMSLAIRGSEKSAYGKVFEKLVLGSLLHTLGFTMITEAQAAAGEVGYVLSSTEKRESDATLYTAADQVIRFDLGFIGQGNPEITLDKVTRFEREMPVAGRRKYVSTVIIVDSVSEKSKVPELAKEVGGMVFEMRRNDWLLSVAAHFERLFGYDAAHLRADPEGVIRAAVDAAPFVTFLQVAKSKPAKSKASKSKASEEV
ncbi:MAG TPA: CfrBI family restriction endonuclease, partial [Rhodothermales bacterium]|nr:CfrBI family restriction endonuclease [Rhodothermales bacterium]